MGWAGHAALMVKIYTEFESKTRKRVSTRKT